MLVFAQTPIDPIIYSLSSVRFILVVVIYIFIAVVTIYFILNIISVISTSKSEKTLERKALLNRLLFSIVAIFLLVSLWGIVYFFQRITGVSVGGVGQEGDVIFSPTSLE